MLFRKKPIEKATLEEAVLKQIHAQIDHVKTGMTAMIQLAAKGKVEEHLRKAKADLLSKIDAQLEEEIKKVISEVKITMAKDENSFELKGTFPKPLK